MQLNVILCKSQMVTDDKLLGARRWYLFSENESVLIMNGPVAFSGGELAATLPMQMS